MGLVVPGAHEPVHAPLTHVSPVHGTAVVPHWPHELHVCTPLPSHWVAPGVHTGADGQEHVCHSQLEPHVCVPYVLHVCVAFAAHAPSPMQVPSCKVPLALHVCVSVPQLPHATVLVAPGMHIPLHMPWLHTYSHAVP